MPYLPWLDIAKIIGIFFVIYGHGGQAGSATPFIYSFHMPLFFFISGMLYRPMTFSETLRKDLRTLVVPYLLLNLLCWQPTLWLHLLRGTCTTEYLWGCIGGTLMGLGYNVDGFTPISTPCWFIYALFLARLIVSLLPSKGKWGMVFLSAAAIGATLVLQHYNIDTYVPIDSAILALPFLCWGYVLRDWVTYSVETFNYKLWFKIGFFLSTGMMWYLLVVFNGRVDTNTCNVGNYIVFYYVAALCAIWLILKVSCLCTPMDVKQIGGGKKSFQMHPRNSGVQPACDSLGTEIPASAPTD